MLISNQKGVSLIEVIIGLVLLALLLMMGVPEYSKFLANARLKATTDTLVSGLSLARAEAVKRNARVEMILTEEDPIEGLVNALPQSTSGKNWVVREFVPRTGGYNFIEGKLGAEGSGKESGTSVQISSSSAEAAYDGRVTFNGFGGLSIGQPIIFQITNPAGGSCATPTSPAPMRCLTIMVSPGGQIRTCDPAVDPVTHPTDTRAC